MMTNRCSNQAYSSKKVLNQILALGGAAMSELCCFLDRYNFCLSPEWWTSERWAETMPGSWLELEFRLRFVNVLALVRMVVLVRVVVQLWVRVRVRVRVRVLVPMLV